MISGPGWGMAGAYSGPWLIILMCFLSNTNNLYLENKPEIWLGLGSFKVNNKWVLAGLEFHL